MKLLCISASNICHEKRGASIRACEAIQRIARRITPGNVESEIIALAKLEPSPCVGCGGCYPDGACRTDDVFNSIMDRMKRSDAVFIVSPHYAPIPAKLCMVLEKLEQIAFLNWINGAQHGPELAGKPVGIVAHGGSDDPRALPVYRRMVLDTVADALKIASLNVVDAGEGNPNGVVFKMKESKKVPGSIFPVEVFDWDEIERELAPLVANVLKFATG